MAGQESEALEGAGAVRPRRSAFGFQLATLAVLPALAAAVLATIALGWSQAAEELVAQRGRLAASAGMAAAAAAQAVAAGDKVAAHAALIPVLSVPGVNYARIERPDGAILVEAASTRAAEDKGRLAADVVRPTRGLEWNGRAAEVSAPIPYAGRAIGQVVLLTETPGLVDALSAGLGLALSAAAPAALLGLGAALLMRRRQFQTIAGIARTLNPAESIEPGAELAALASGIARLTDAGRRATGRATALDAEVRGRAAAYARAEATVAGQARLLTAMSQELKPALAGVEALADALAEGGPAIRQRRMAQTAARAGTVLSSAVDDFMGLAGLAPAPKAEHGEIDLLEAAEDTVELFWRRAAAAGIDLAVYVDPILPRAIAGDPGRLRRALASLTDLALRACASGGVLLEAEPDSPGWVRVSVRVAGVPAPLPANDPVPVICRRLAETMGGALQFVGKPGQPLAAILRLPFRSQTEAPAWPAAPVKGAGARLTHEGVATRRALARYLVGAGYRLDMDEEEGPPALIASAPSTLDPDRPSSLPTVAIGELAEVQALVKSGAAQAGLAQPFRRMELESLLRSLSSGAPLADPADPARKVEIDAESEQENEALMADLDQAIARNELSLVYQPQFDRDGRQILGVESLIRWSHPRRGLVSPALFIPLAEHSGRIEPLTDWVINRALIETADFKDLQVAFNVSAIEFAKAGVVERIMSLIEVHGADPRTLEVEITETAILDAEEQVKKNMAALRARGVKMALDDFGAGYSSLGHLRRYPFDKLKIDREFVTDCTGDVQSATVVHAVVSIGRALGMEVIAEGVETESQRQFLKVAGVHAMQGYLFGRPMTAAALGALLAEHKAEAEKARLKMVGKQLDAALAQQQIPSDLRQGIARVFKEDEPVARHRA